MVEAHRHISQQQSGFVRAGRKFVVNRQSAKAGEPGKRALHDPAFSNRHEAPPGAGRAAANLVGEAQLRQVPGKASTVTFIRHHCGQAFAPGESAGQQVAGLPPIVAVGCVHAASQQAALYIGNYMPLTAIYPLAAIQAPVFKNARGQLDALAV